MKRKAESLAERKIFNKEAKMDALANFFEEHWEFTNNSYDLVLCSSINRFFDDIGIKSISKSSTFINDVLREKFGYHASSTIFCHKIKLTVLPEQFGSIGSRNIGQNTPERINNKFWRGIKHRTNQELNFFHYGARDKPYDPIKKYEQYKKENCHIITDDNNKYHHQRQVLCVTPTRVTELHDHICEPLHNEMVMYPPLTPKSQNTYNIIQSLDDDFVALFYPESTI